MFLYGASVTILIVHFSLSVVIQFKKRKILLRAKIFNLVIFFFFFCAQEWIFSPMEGFTAPL